MRPEVYSIQKLNINYPEKDKLSNGIETFLINSTDLDFIEISIILNASSWYEKVNLASNFTATMLNEGTSTKDAKTINEFFEFYGADFNAKQEEDYTTISIKVLNKNLENVLPLVKELLIDASFPEDEFNTLITRTDQNLDVQEKKPNFVAQRLFMNAIHGETHPYANKLTHANLINLNTQYLKEFYKNHYTYKNTKIIVAGKINKDLANILDKYFGDNWNSEALDNQQLEWKLEPNKNLEITDSIGNSMQAGLRIGSLSVNLRNPDFTKLRILSYVLGAPGNLTSRLMQNIREQKGYTYGIYAQHYSNLHSGYFSIYSEVGKEYIDATIKEVFIEIERLKSDLIPEQELEQTKNSIVGRIMQALDDPISIADVVAELSSFDLDLNYYNNVVDEIRSTTAQELRDLANKYYIVDTMHKIIVK